MRRIRLRAVAILGALVVPIAFLPSGVSMARSDQPGGTTYLVYELGSLGGTGYDGAPVMGSKKRRSSIC